MTLQGDALDRLGRYAEAFAAYSASNEVSARRFANFEWAAGSYRDPVERLGREFATIDPASWKNESANEQSPAFLIGYPRSGTTLLENILASIPDVVALEERPLSTILRE